ncbi:MAG: alpha-N-arabinofuranosidase [Planctomycetota bacterium]|jgi:alpha-N-arabinofuranosidase
MSNNNLLNVILITVLAVVVLGANTEFVCAQNKLVIQADLGKVKIDKNIYGHFSEHLGRCVYEGYWVGEDSPIPNTRGIRNDVVEALKEIKIPVLRWPGGCFADEYHWKDGIGPRDKRPAMINTHWGGVTENNHFGTHEFLDLCEQIGCEAFITGNVGSGTAQELSEWVEYVNFDGVSPMADLRRENGREEPWKVKYWGVGNENWGCGGNMQPSYYADVYRRFQTYVRSYPGARTFKVACGPYGQDIVWMETLMKNVKEGNWMHGIDLHYYCGSGEDSSSATEFKEIDWFYQLRRAMELNEILTKQSNIMDKYDPQKRVSLIVGEWGAWHDVEPGTNEGFLYQQNSLRDALVAGVSLNIMNQHCERVRMGNIAQTVNVLQAMILTDGPKMILTPSYHVFDLYKVHHDATLLDTDLDCSDYRFEEEETPGLNVSASRDDSGKIHISICNLNPNDEAELSCEIRGAKTSKISGQVLTAPEITSHNTFDNPEVVKPSDFSKYNKTENGFETALPARSIVVFEIE